MTFQEHRHRTHRRACDNVVVPFQVEGETNATEGKPAAVADVLSAVQPSLPSIALVSVSGIVSRAMR